MPATIPGSSPGTGMTERVKRSHKTLTESQHSLIVNNASRTPEGRARPCEPGVGNDSEAGPSDTRRCLNGFALVARKGQRQRGLSGGSDCGAQIAEGAAKGLCRSTRPSAGRSGTSTPWTVAGGHCGCGRGTGHKTPCAGGPADKAEDGTSIL